MSFSFLPPSPKNIAPYNLGTVSLGLGFDEACFFFPPATASPRPSRAAQPGPSTSVPCAAVVAHFASVLAHHTGESGVIATEAAEAAMPGQAMAGRGQASNPREKADGDHVRPCIGRTCALAPDLPFNSQEGGA